MDPRKTTARLAIALLATALAVTVSAPTAAADECNANGTIDTNCTSGGEDCYVSYWSTLAHVAVCQGTPEKVLEQLGIVPP